MAQIVKSLARSNASPIPLRAFLLLFGVLCSLTVHAQGPPLQGPLIHRVPFTLRGDAIWIQAKVNGYSATLKLDTAATSSAFAGKFLPRRNDNGEVEVRTAAGNIKANRSEAHLEIGDLDLSLPQAVYFRNYFNQGVIGLDVLDKFKRVTIDFENREIDLEDWGPTRVYRPGDWDGQQTELKRSQSK